MSYRCTTRGCKRQSALGDFLCSLCRTRRLRDTRPIFMEGPGAYEGTQPYDSPDPDARRMREGA